MEKYRSKKAKGKMRVKPAVYRDSYLKKQSQFSKDQNDVISMLTMVYGDLSGPRRRKNKANSKPNKANLPAFGRKSVILSPKSETDRMETKKQIPARFTECYLKKQSQFLMDEIELKYLYER